MRKRADAKKTEQCRGSPWCSVMRKRADLMTGHDMSCELVPLICMAML